MIGILKDEDEFYIEVHPTRPKWRVRIPCRCSTFGEYGVSFGGGNFTLYWHNTGYHSLRDAIQDLIRFIKRKLK